MNLPLLGGEEVANERFKKMFNREEVANERFKKMFNTCII